jgi:Protein of unknown function (DUF2934)
MDPECRLPDQPSILVLPDWWQELVSQGRGSKPVAKAKAGTPKKSAAKALPTKNGTAVSYSTQAQGIPVPEAAIRLCAYLKWEAAGKPPGDGMDFWLQARHELLPDK